MADEEKKIIVDDDWKAEAQKEKERLAKEEEQAPTGPLPDPNFAELVNMIAMQAMAGFGMLAGPGGQRIPPNYEIAKHYIDMLQVIEDKTKGNLTDEEKKLLDQVMYELRMQFVQVSGGGGGAPPAAGP